jgi:hypothetical protein
MVPVKEETHSLYRGKLVDRNGNNLQSSDVASLEMYLFDPLSGDYINNRYEGGANADLRNGGSWDQGCTIIGTNEWNLTLVLTPTDNVVVNTNLKLGEEENHTMLFVGTTTSSPSETFKHYCEKLTIERVVVPTTP